MNRRQFCRNTLSLFLTGSLPLLLSACQPTDETTDLIKRHQENHAFPVTISHALGSVTLTQQPQRIICLGAGSEDITLALGFMPIAIEPHIWGGDDQGYLPWFKEAIENQGAPLPQLITMYPELDVAKIARLQPDIILAPQSGLTPEIYRQISTIAPVIAYPARPWLTPVNLQIDLIAAALGVSEKGDALQSSMQATMAQLRTQYPALQNYRFAYLNAGSRMANLSVYIPGDPRVDSLIALGLQPGKQITQLEPKPGSFAANIGLENIDQLQDIDIVISWFNNETVKREVDQIPLYQEIPAIKHQSYIPLTDQALVMAMSYGSPLSLPWGLQRFLPRLLDILPYADQVQKSREQ